jgi:hypothetical protein
MLIMGLLVNGLHENKRELILHILGRLGKFCQLQKETISWASYPVSDQEKHRILQAQFHAKTGEGVIVYIEKPYHLDFRKDRTYAVDIPCFVSPYPGMPCNGAFKEMTAFFEEINVKYLLISRSFMQNQDLDIRNNLKDDSRNRYSQPMNPYKGRYIYLAYLRFHSFLNTALARYRIIYDDGDFVLLATMDNS